MNPHGAEPEEQQRRYVALQSWRVGYFPGVSLVQAFLWNCICTQVRRMYLTLLRLTLILSDAAWLIMQGLLSRFEGSRLTVLKAL